MSNGDGSGEDLTLQQRRRLQRQEAMRQRAQEGESGGSEEEQGTESDGARERTTDSGGDGSRRSTSSSSDGRQPESGDGEQSGGDPDLTLQQRQRLRRQATMSRRAAERDGSIEESEPVELERPPRPEGGITQAERERLEEQAPEQTDAREAAAETGGKALVESDGRVRPTDLEYRQVELTEQEQQTAQYLAADEKGVDPGRIELGDDPERTVPELTDEGEDRVRERVLNERAQAEAERIETPGEDTDLAEPTTSPGPTRETTRPAESPEAGEVARELAYLPVGTVQAAREDYSAAIDDDVVEGVSERRVVPEAAEDRLVEAGEYVGDRIRSGADDVADRLEIAGDADVEDAPGGAAGRAAFRVGRGTEDVLQSTVRGVGEGAASFAALPGSGVQAVDRTVAAGRYVADEPRQVGAVGVTAAGVVGAGAAGTVQEVAENPVEGTARVGTEIAGGTALIRGIERGATAARGARIRAASDQPEVRLEEITSERGARGELPQFETSPSAPTATAVREVRTRAADTPEPVREATETDRALYHSTESDLGDQFDVQEGGSELPGLFTSPDASPLRLAEGSDSSGGVRVGLPSVRGEGDRIVAVPGDDVRGMPDYATGSGRVQNADGDYQPDPETSGYQYLTEHAEPGAAYVRPTGGRTTELEAIVPPGTGFEQVSTVPVRIGGRDVSVLGREFTLGGRTIPMDVVQRRRSRSDADADRPQSAADGDGTVTASELSTRVTRAQRRASRREQTPALPAGASFASSSRTRSNQGVRSSPSASSSQPASAGSAGSSATPNFSEAFSGFSPGGGGSSGSPPGSGGSSGGGGYPGGPGAPPGPARPSYPGGSGDDDPAGFEERFEAGEWERPVVDPGDALDAQFDVDLPDFGFDR